MTSLFLLALLGQLDFSDGPAVVSSCPLIDANCGTRPVATTRASLAWWVRTDGGVSVADAGFGRYDERGLLSYAGESNVLPGLFSAWSLSHANLSDGGVTVNPTLGAVGSCPYADPMGGATAVAVSFPAIEDLGATPAGRSQIGATYTSTAVAWAHDVRVRACDATDGGTLYYIPGSWSGESQSCAAGASWLNCSKTKTGFATSTSMLIGPDSRTVYGQPTSHPALCACLWAPSTRLGSVVGPPIVCGASPCATAADQSVVPSAGYPTTSGRVRLTYMPWATSASVRCLLDTIASNNGLRLCTAADNTLVLTLGNGTSTTTTTSAAQTWTGGTDYALEVEWGGGLAFVRKAGTLIATTLDGTAKVPTAHATNIAYGSLIAGTSSANGWVSKPVWSTR